MNQFWPLDCSEEVSRSRQLAGAPVGVLAVLEERPESRGPLERGKERRSRSHHLPFGPAWTPSPRCELPAGAPRPPHRQGDLLTLLAGARGAAPQSLRGPGAPCILIP